MRTLAILGMTLLLLSTLAIGQSTTGKLVGTVTDASGAVAGATIVVIWKWGDDRNKLLTGAEFAAERPA